jgi:hypothetical protein
LHGYGETDWRILPTADQDYRKQVTAWDRREFTDARGARRTEWWCPQGRQMAAFPVTPLHCLQSFGFFLAFYEASFGS